MPARSTAIYTIRTASDRRRRQRKYFILYNIARTNTWVWPVCAARALYSLLLLFLESFKRSRVRWVCALLDDFFSLVVITESICFARWSWNTQSANWWVRFGVGRYNRWYLTYIHNCQRREQYVEVNKFSSGVLPRVALNFAHKFENANFFFLLWHRMLSK